MMIFGAIDTPSIDYVIPRWEIIESKLDNKDMLNTASKLYDNIILHLTNAHLPGSKFTIDKSTADICRKLALELEEILASIDMEVQYAGGTGYRKLFYSKFILRNKISARLFGATGNDIAGRTLKNIISKNNIELIDNNEKLPFTREVILITPKHSNDRIGAKFPYQEAAFFHDENKLIEYAKSCDCFFLESSLIKFLGKDKFINFCKNLFENKVNIVYAPPTDRSFFIDKDGRVITDNINAFRAAAKYAKLITMNELEAIWYMDDVNFYEKIYGRDDDNLLKTIESIKKLLQNYNDKMVLVTVGEHGMIGINKTLVIEKDAIKVGTIINTVGAGDSAAAAVASTLSQHGFKTDNFVMEKCLEKACELSAYVIEHQPGK